MKCDGQKVPYNRWFGIQKTGCEAFARHVGVEGAARTSTTRDATPTVRYKSMEVSHVTEHWLATGH